MGCRGTAFPAEGMSIACTLLGSRGQCSGDHRGLHIVTAAVVAGMHALPGQRPNASRNRTWRALSNLSPAVLLPPSQIHLLAVFHTRLHCRFTLSNFREETEQLVSAWELLFPTQDIFKPNWIS